MKKIELGKYIINELLVNGYQAYFVGGFVRDYLLQRELNDIDIATDALPETVLKMFPHTVPTGLKHGTITVILEGIPYEITTFRNEGKYLDFRHPSKVEFVSSLYEDLKRRDFTMNAMAMDSEGKIIDPFFGQSALKNKAIIAVDNPKERFLEDPLRMMRAVRFAAQLDFNIEEQTWKGIRSNAQHLLFIATERIKIEFDKIMKAAYAEKGVKLLFESDLIKWIKGIYQTGIITVDYHRVTGLFKLTDNFLERWALLLHSLNADERTGIMKSLRFANKEVLSVNKLFQAYHILSQSPNSEGLKKALIRTDQDACFSAIRILFLLDEINMEHKINLTNDLSEISQSLKVRKITDLAISGQDLIVYFKDPPGPWIKEILNNLFEMVIYNNLANEKSVLLRQAEKIKEGIINEGKN